MRDSGVGLLLEIGHNVIFAAGFLSRMLKYFDAGVLL